MVVPRCLRSRTAKTTLILILLNEIRGLIVVAGVLAAWWSA